MIFVEALTIPANTPKTAPIIATIPIIQGTITLVSVQFPPGVNALAHVKVLWGLYQLFPSNEQGDFATGGETVVWDETIDITTEPLQLVMQGWNLDDTYDHTITLRVVMKPATNQQSTAQVLAALQGQQVNPQSG